MNDLRKGNVLFLILIAVALFAALSYAVTSSSRSGSTDQITKDQARLMAAQIRQYASSLEQAVTKLTVINKCTDNEISFDNPVTQAYADIDLANPRSPVDHSCDVFHGNGGGMSYRVWDEKFLGDTGNASYSQFRSYSVFMSNLEVLNAGSEKAEMLLVIPWLKPEICEELNKKFSDIESMRVSINIGNPTQYIGPSTMNDSGGTYVIYVNGGWVPSPFQSGCGLRSASPGAEWGGHTFYYVLKTR